MNSTAPSSDIPAVTPVHNAGAEAPPDTSREHRRVAWRAQARRWLLASMSSDTLWPYVAVLSPLIITSVLAPLWLSLAMGALSLLALNKVAPQLEANLWAVGARSAFLRYVVPLQVLLLAWVAMAAAAGSGQHIAATVFPYVATLCLVVAPACRWRRERSTRRVPLRWSLGLVSALVLLAHGSAAVNAWGAR